MRSLILLFVVTLAAAFGKPSVLQAQTDSVSLCRTQGPSLLEAKQYAAAYCALDYYLKNAPREDRQTEVFAQYMKLRSQAFTGVQSELKELYKKIEAARKQGNDEEAAQLSDLYIQNCVAEAFRQQEPYPYSVALTCKALWLRKQGKTQEALPLLNQAVQVRLTSEHLDKVHAAETYNHIANAYHQLGQFDQAIEQCEKAREIYLERYGKKHENYATTLVNLAGYYISRNAPGDRQHAVELGEEAVKALPKNHPAYALAINSLVVYYSMSGDKVKAQQYAKTAKASLRKVDRNSLGYANVLSNQALRLANAANYEQAAEDAYEAIAIFEQHGDSLSLNFAHLLSNTASFEKHNEHFREAISLWERASRIYERIQTRSGSDYLNCMSEISAAYAKMGNLEKAADINEQFMSNNTQKGSGDDAHYAQSLTKRASVLAGEGNYRDAIFNETNALKIFRRRNEMADVASSLSDISNYLYHMGDVQQAIDTCQTALGIFESVSGHEEDRGLAFNNLSIYYFSQGKFEEALHASQSAEACFKESNRTETSFFAKVLTNQALYEAMRDSLSRAIAISARADTIQQKLLGSQHPDNVMLTFNRAVYHIRNRDSIEGQRLFHRAMTLQMDHVRSNFSHLTTRRREMYWGTRSYVFRYAPYVACLIAGSDSARVDAYNSLLFTKGLLLNSEVDFRNLLAHTANEDIQEKYAALEAIHQQIDAGWKRSSATMRDQLEELTQKANRLERELTKGSKEFGDFTAAMNINVDQVKGALPADAAAIEFFDIATREGEHSYWALLVRPHDRVPQLVRLFDESEIEGLTYDGIPFRKALQEPHGIDSVYNDKRIGRLVWEPLMPFLQGIHSVWFSPSGLFYQFGIEYLAYGEQRVTDLFTLHRVSSTKQLVSNASSLGRGASGKGRHLKDAVSHAAVFGGIDYDASPQELQAANDKLGKQVNEYLNAYKTMLQEDAADMAMIESKTRDGFTRDGLGSVDFLSGTERESNAIYEILLEEDVKVDQYEGKSGTEEAFKALSGSGLTLLHVATHGFTLSEDEAQLNMADLAYLGMREGAADQTDNSLCYAGLLMAGANHTLDKKQMPEGMENAVLTAREIALMDLRGLELVVLSACQTGRGLLRDDGVFGLQRGFKKAGAHTLLMSLWSVDDRATMMMMTAFYKELANGASRHEAFRAAQHTLREDPRFSRPVYWASFIMLDD